MLHPNIVAALDAEQAGATHFLVTEYVEGINLYQRLQQRGRLPIEQACDCARQAALGLQHAFERGLVHRDVKPHNLMLTPEGQVKILDFGLARFVGQAAEEEGDEADLSPEEGAVAGLTPAHRGLGTPDYLAPEVARDARRADIRADVYGLGCTLYHLLGGQVPFPGGTSQEKLERHVLRNPPPVNDLRVGVPGKLARVVERMMGQESGPALPDAGRGGPGPGPLRRPPAGTPLAHAEVKLGASRQKVGARFQLAQNRQVENLLRIGKLKTCRHGFVRWFLGQPTSPADRGRPGKGVHTGLRWRWRCQQERLPTARAVRHAR
jgi:serine/threonine protein kinase